MEIAGLIRQKVIEAVKDIYNIDFTEFTIEHPENSDFGDYATNVSMNLAKLVKQSPIDIANKLSYKLQEMDAMTNVHNTNLQIFKSVKVASPGFINFVLTTEWLQNVLLDLHKNGNSYRAMQKDGKKRIALEHSNVNPNKAAHVGHLRNACIGQFLERVYEHLGYEVEVQYYCNDLGVQVTTSTMGEEKFKDIKPEDYKKFDHYMWDVYSKMASLIENNAELKAELNERLVKLENPESAESEKQKQLATKILKTNLETFSKLDFDYDVIVYESDIARLKLWEKAFEILKQNENFYLAKDGPSKDCWLIKLTEKDDSTVQKDGKTIEEDKIIVRSNGVATYTGKDIAYHMWKYGLLGTDFHYEPFVTETQKKELWSTTYLPHESNEKVTFSNVNKVFDVIDTKQTYAINVVKQSLRYLGYEDQAENMVHVNYGFVYLSPETATELGVDTSDGKNKYGMSGRKGWGIKIDDFIDMVDKKMTSEFGEFAALKDVRNGAIKFEMLKYNTYQDLIFDLKSALNIKGFSGTYIQYTYARTNSLLTKAEKVEDQTLQTLEDRELDVLRELYKFSEIVERAASEFAPNLLCGYLFELCQKFNFFYNDLSILNADSPEKKKFRVLLTYGVNTVLKNGLYLLGIAAPDKM
ncbi:MAG TPA: arginine--tRNA ligase [Candidatus Saccharimonadales bacterium]|nr:arginine--tRNA ligase [Candidatus Saccharimonadales bacterium]